MRKGFAIVSLFVALAAHAQISPPFSGGGGGGVGASVTLENVYAAPGSFTFAHNLNSLFYQVHCVTRVGAGYGSATYSDVPIDANDSSITVPAAGDYICAFSAVTALQPDFQVAATPTSQTYWPTMSGTQQPTFTVNQTGISGYSGTANYTTSGLASGMTGAYSPTSITGTGSSVLTLSFPANQAAATTSFTVQGADGTHTHTASPSITVGNINSGLADCWPMTDGSGTTFADGCGTSNTETLNSAVTWATHTGLPGSTPAYSGTSVASGANNTATNFNGATAFSVSFWINATSNATADIVSNLNATPVGFDVGFTTGVVQFYLINVFGSNYMSVQSTTTVTANALHYIVVTYDGSKNGNNVKMYEDGAALTTTVTANSLTGSTANSTPVSLGGRPSGSFSIANGSVLAYTRIYNRVLSSTDVSNYFAAGAR